MNKTKEFIIWFVFTSIFKVAYELSYVLGVSELYAYMKLVYTPNLGKCIVSYVLFAVCYFFLPIDKNKPSYYLLRIMYMFTVIPILSMYWQADRATEYAMIVVLAFFIVCLVANHIKINNIKLIKCSYNISQILLIAITLLLIVFTLRFGIADLRALDIYNVYAIRSERTYPGLWGYIINWLTYALIPALICRSLSENRRSVTIIAAIYQVYLYMFTGSKTVLFSVVLILVSYYLVSKKYNFLKFWSITLGIVCLIPLFLYKAFRNIGFIGIFPTRLLSIPASINFNHYDFFSNNQKLYLVETFIGRLFNLKSPYDQFSTYLVSTGSGNANVGFIGDAFDNGGILFVIVFAVIVGLLMTFFDALYKKNGTKLSAYVGALTYTMIYLNEGPLTSALITGGIWIHVFILMMHDSNY